MPIYEYKCKDCGQIVSELRRMAEREAPLACPQCGGEAEVVLSQFSAGRGSSGAQDWSPCDECSSGPT